MEMSARCRSLRSPNRDMVAAAKKLQKAGKKIYFFNIGDPNKFDFDTPQYLKDAMKQAIDRKVGHYSDSEGDDELRQAIAAKEAKNCSISLKAEDVIVTSGISEGLMFLLDALIEPGRGDEIMMPGPPYSIYPQMTAFSGGKPVSYRLVEENLWQTDMDDFRKKISSKTRAVCLINPNNPTGSVFHRATLKKIIDIAGEFNLPLISDEIYDRLVFDTEHVPTASLAKDVPVIGLNGFSKVYLMPGWRMGYIYFHDPNGGLKEIQEGVKALCRQRLSAATPMQAACAKAFDPVQEKHIKETVAKLRERAYFAHKRLNEIDGISTQRPEGAFYIFPKVAMAGRWPDDRAFITAVLNATGIVLSDGSGFDPVYGKDHFRSVILPPVAVMDEAFGKLEQFMAAGMRQPPHA